MRGWLLLNAHVKVCGCRPHEGGAVHRSRRTQTPNGRNRGRCVEASRKTLWEFWRRRSVVEGVDGELCRPVAMGRTGVARRIVIDERLSGRRAGDHDRGRSGAGEAEVQHWNVAANLIMMCRS